MTLHLVSLRLGIPIYRGRVRRVLLTEDRRVIDALNHHRDIND